MTKHLLQIDGRTILMSVHETADEIVCDLSLFSKSVGWSPAQFEYICAWFNAIIGDLRENSCKCIHLFDRQHVMTS